MKNQRTIRKRYIGLIYVLVVILISVIAGGAYFFINADTTNGMVDYTDPPQLSGTCTAADINLVVDISGSTASQISNYKSNLAQFVTNTENSLPDTNWTLTTFGSNVQTVTPWSKDTQRILRQISQLSANGGTATATGIQQALSIGSASTALGTNNTSKIMLIITDGLPNITLSYQSENISYPINSINDAITQANNARTAGYSTIVVDTRSSNTGDSHRNDTIRGLAGTDVPTLAGDVIPTSFENLSANLTKPFECKTDILSLTKTVDNTSPNLGSEVNYTLTVKNNNTSGQAKATNIKVTDALPNGVTLVKATPSSGTYTDPQWTIPELVANATATLNITAKVTTTATPDQAITNTASIVSQDQTDTDMTNNTATAAITPQVEKTDILSLTKTVDNDNPKIGTDVTYTITIKNNNSANQPKATNIKVSDVLPDGIYPLVTIPSAGTYTAPNWSIPELDQGKSATLKIEANVTAGVVPDTALTNTAKVDSLDQADSDTSNNTATATITPYQEKTNILSLIKKVDNDKPKIGDNVNYTLTVKNTGSAGSIKATNIVVKDVLPDGVTFVKSTPSSGTYTDSNWNISEVDPGAQANLTIEAKVNDDAAPDQTIQNIASITSLDQGDSNLDDNTAAITITPYKDTPPVETPSPTPTLKPISEPTKTSDIIQPEPTAQVSGTKTGPKTVVIYVIAALLSALALVSIYLSRKRKDIEKIW